MLTKIFVAAFIIGAGFMVGRVYLLYPLLNTLSVDPSMTLGIFNKALLPSYTRIIAEFITVTLLIFTFLWIWWRRPDWVLRSLLLTALLVFGWRCEVLYREATTPFLRVSLQSSVKGQAQLYYDKGQSLNEIDSKKANVRPDGQYQDYLFPLPRSEAISAFRFDPLMGSGTMRIREMAIVNGFGHRRLAIDLRLWRAGHQIREFDLQNHEMIVVTEKEANDPQLDLTFSSPLVLNWSRSFMTDAFLGRVLLECLIVGVFTALVLIVLKIFLKSSMPPGEGMFWDVLFLLASLLLLRVYAFVKWEDTISFVLAWLNS